jgi:preprotein translocase subunit SecF
MGVLKWQSPREEKKSVAAQSLFTSLCERAKVEDNKDNFDKLFEIVKAGGELSQYEERIFYSAFAENKKFGVGFVTSKDERISKLTDEAKLSIAENCDSLWHLLEIRGTLENDAAGEVDKAISKLLLKNDDNVSKRFRDDCYHAGDYNKEILEDWMKSFDAAKLVEAGVDPQALAESIDEYFRGDKKTKILDKFEFPYKMSWSDKRDGIREYNGILSGWKGIALGSDMSASNLESDYKKIATMAVYARMLNLAVLDVRTNGFHDERKNEFIKHVNKKLVNEGMEPVTEFKDAVTMYADMEKKRLETGYERFEESEHMLWDREEHNREQKDRQVKKDRNIFGKVLLVLQALATILFMVLVFMLVMYRLPGVAADMALLIYVLIVFYALAITGAQLTLQGIAGILLGIGMAVDANVVIFERFREELKEGRTPLNAVKFGLRNAGRAVLDSNVTTLIAAVVLMIFGTGTIKGFATTLMISIIASYFTAVVVTRGLLILICKLGINNRSAYTR